MGPRMCLLATDAGELAGDRARTLNNAGSRLGLEVIQLCSESPDEAWIQCVDFLTALDAPAVMMARRRIGYATSILVVETSPDAAMQRAVRLVDAVVVPPDLCAEYRQIPLRPSVSPMPPDGEGWRDILGRAVANRGIHALA